jgi:hypothetical protein
MASKAARWQRRTQPPGIFAAVDRLALIRDGGA